MSYGRINANERRKLSAYLHLTQVAVDVERSRTEHVVALHAKHDDTCFSPPALQRGTVERDGELTEDKVTRLIRLTLS